MTEDPIPSTVVTCRAKGEVTPEERRRRNAEAVSRAQPENKARMNEMQRQYQRRYRIKPEVVARAQTSEAKRKHAEAQRRYYAKTQARR